MALTPSRLFPAIGKCRARLWCFLEAVFFSMRKKNEEAVKTGVTPVTHQDR
jgi:hypothetical protein